MAWYREWFGHDYLDLYAHRDLAEAEGNVEFVEERLGPPRPRAVLDLACGAGRHTEALRRRGHRALGVDLSLTLLAGSPHLPRVRGDMRGLPFTDASFDWVLNFFTSFGYFESERENFRVLEEIVRVLTPGGRFVIDFFNRDRVLAELRPRETVVEDDRRVDVERWYDPAACRINKRITVRRQGAAPRTFLESIRAYSGDEVTSGLAWAGLELTDLYGDFQGAPFTRDSERLILVGRKPA
jgi:SAM-dependent methyltransferase